LTIETSPFGYDEVRLNVYDGSKKKRDGFAIADGIPRLTPTFYSSNFRAVFIAMNQGDEAADPPLQA
jgi:hypothetical protein